MHCHSENALTESFPVKSGVRQECIISPVLFRITIDWVMRQTTSHRPRGILWNLFTHLEDLNFPDEMAVMPFTQRKLYAVRVLGVLGFA